MKKLLLVCLVLGCSAFADQVNCIKWKDSSGATVGTYCKPFTIKAGSNITFSDDQLTRVLTINSGSTVIENVRYADQFTGVDAGDKINAAIADLPSTGGTVDAKALEGAQTISTLITISKPITILFGYATYTCSASQCFQVTSNGVNFLGSGSAPAFATDGSGNLGTIFKVSTAGGSFIVLGSDNGHAYDVADYDGYQGTRLANLQITNSGAVTALNNAKGSFGNGSYAIRDWRGGGVHLDDVSITHFQYGFWGIQSDLNNFKNLSLQYNSVGMYLGPRSDQNILTNLYSFFNDNVVTLDGAVMTKFYGGASDSDGSSTTYAFDLVGSLSKSTAHTLFDGFWFENFTGKAATTYPAFIRVGHSVTTAPRMLTIRNPIVTTNASPTTPRTQYFVEFDNADGLFIEEPEAASTPNDGVDAYVNFVGTTSPTKVELQRSRINNITAFVFNGSGTPQVILRETGGGVVAYRDTNDQSFELGLDAGVSAAQSVIMNFKDRGTNKWAFQKNTSNNFNLLDSANSSFTRFAFVAGGSTSINSLGANAINLNVTASGGTGGENFGDGAGNTVASVNSSGLGTFNGGVKVAAAISPTAAGGQTAGTNALPFSSAFIGAAATNNAQLTGTFTAARVHTLPDITGKVGVYLSASDATVDLASVASAACTSERSVAVAGAAFGDPVQVMAGTSLEDGTFLKGHVISSGNIKWAFCNLSGGAVDRASDTYSIRVVK